MNWTDQRLVLGEQEMLNFGMEIAPKLGDSSLVTLSGDLGSGKTTLARGVLRGLGYEGSVKSPTYTLVESYECRQKSIYHFDFYRIQDPLELELVGIPELLTLHAIRLVEWPSLGGEYLPKADVCIGIEPARHGRMLNIESGFRLS